MNEKDTQLIQDHLEDNPELSGLWEEHLTLEQRLAKIDRKPFLNPDEKTERKRLQLAKLAGKTKMEVILNGYRYSHA